MDLVSVIELDATEDLLYIEFYSYITVCVPQTDAQSSTHMSQPTLTWKQNRVCGHLKDPRKIP